MAQTPDRQAHTSHAPVLSAPSVSKQVAITSILSLTFCTRRNILTAASHCVTAAPASAAAMAAASAAAAAALTEGDAALPDEQFERRAVDGVAVAVSDRQREVHRRDACLLTSARDTDGECCGGSRVTV